MAPSRGVVGLEEIFSNEQLSFLSFLSSDDSDFSDVKNATFGP